MVAKWFVEKNGKWYGPFSSDRLKSLAEEGKIQRTGVIRKGENGKTFQAAMVKGLFDDVISQMAVSNPHLIRQSPVSDETNSQRDNFERERSGEPANTNVPDSESTPLSSHSDASVLSSSDETGADSLASPTPSSLDLGVGDAMSLKDGDDFGLAAAISDLRSLNYDYLIPFRKMFSWSLLRKKAVRWVIGFGLFPLLLLFLKENLEWTFEQSIWFVGGYFCLFWAAYFYELLRPEGKVWQRGMRWALFTVLVGLPLLFIAQQLPVISTLYSGTKEQSLFLRVAGYVLAVGVLEETCKALPLIVFALRKNESLTLKNGVFLGMMSGFGFALAEVVQYSLQYWGQNASISAMAIAKAVDGSTTHTGVLNATAFGTQMEELLPALSELYGNTLLVQIVRFMTLPLLHACWAGTVGWFIAVASQQRSKQWAIVVVGIGFTAVLHGLYDVFADGLIGIGIAAVTFLVFMGYLLHGQQEAPETTDSDTIAVSKSHRSK